MQNPIRSALALLLCLVLAATACGGDDANDPVATGTVDDAADTRTEADGDPDAPATDAAGSDPADEPTAVPPVTEAAGTDTAPADEPEALLPLNVINTFARNTYVIEPTADEVACFGDRAASDEGLATAVATLGAFPVPPFDDATLRELTDVVHDCVAGESLGTFAAAAIGLRGPAAEAAPACFADQFGADGGVHAFYNYSALLLQNRLDTEHTDRTVDMLAACAPATALSEFFASGSEQAQGFSVAVDRDCLAEALTAPEASQTLWSQFVAGAATPLEAVQPWIDECTSTVESDFDQQLPTGFLPWSGDRDLAGVEPALRDGLYSEPPPMTIDPSRTYTAVFTTGGGEIRIELFADTAPLTVNNFVNLANDGFYDGTIFHRVIAGFMAQGGDPSGTGRGGPGYQFADEFSGGREFDRNGLLAMANSGPATNGSQFFITFAPTPHLTGAHTIFGEVVSGIELVDAIEIRDPANPASRGQVLESVTIEVS